jgi:hypothetical protein
MTELSNPLASSGGEPRTGIVLRHVATLAARLLLAFVPAGSGASAPRPSVGEAGRWRRQG